VRVSQALVLTAAVLTMGGCQTLTEELPSDPTSGGHPQIPVLPPVVVPVPLPVPGPPGAPPPVPQPVPPVPPPTGGGGPPGQIPNNFNPVARVGAKVYFLECNGQMVPDSEFATQAQVGCRIHYDCTPRDASNNPTQSRGYPSWDFSPGGLVNVGNVNDFTPTVTARAPGNLTARVTIDGVTSADVNIQIVN
jgi:hypothetical protein